MSHCPLVRSQVMQVRFLSAVVRLRLFCEPGLGHLRHLGQVGSHEMRNEHEQASSDRETSRRARNDVSYFFHHFILFSHLTHQK